MFKKILFLALAVLYCCVGAQESLQSEKEAIQAIIAKETSGWANRDYQTWASTWQQSTDVIAAVISSGSYNETVGWDKHSANIKWQFKEFPDVIKDKITREKFVIRVDGNLAWATYEQIIFPAGGQNKIHSREMRTLIKTRGQWKLISATTIYDDGFKPGLTAVESSINNAGYQLLHLGNTEKALAVFQLNVVLFPDSWNVYDSLGEAYLKAGNIELATQNYAWSVQLNPNNRIGAKILEQLMQRNDTQGSMQGGPLCERRVGEYVTNDRAYQVRNELQQQGYEAWIENHGSLYAGTRTYVVFAKLPCK